MRKGEYNKFSALMKRLLKVPKSELKAKLDAEKAAKAERPTRRRKATEQK